MLNSASSRARRNPTRTAQKRSVLCRFRQLADYAEFTVGPRGAWTRGLIRPYGLRSFIVAFDSSHCGGSRNGIESRHAVGFPVQTGAPMISHAHQNLTEPAARGFDRVAGYALVAIIAVIFLVALMTNPVLPQ